MSLSDYAEGAILDHLLKTGAFAQPAHIYVGLSTADPLDTGAGLAEPVGNGYARIQADAWNACNGAGSTANTNAVTFPQASGSGWGTCTHFALFDALTGGHLLASGQLSAQKTIVALDTPSFAAGAITFTLD
jgi:hypothetical protein